MTGFQKRFNQLVNKYNLDAKTIANALNVSLNIVYFWMSGARTPGHEKIIALAKYLNTSPGWLLFGEAHTMAISRDNGAGHLIAKGKNVRLPLIHPSEIKHYEKIKDDFMMAEKKDTQTVSRPFVTVSSYDTHLIPVQISGDAMAGDGMGSISLMPGAVVFIDTKLAPVAGDIVAADAKGYKETIIRQYIYQEGKHYLRPLNPRYEQVEIDSIRAIRGVVVRYEYKIPR